ncbi:hypothetical protein SARC_15343, partial [Sphaeroforma arctica JP610]
MYSPDNPNTTDMPYDSDSDVASCASDEVNMEDLIEHDKNIDNENEPDSDELETNPVEASVALFAPPVQGSKRKRVSRVMCIDGHAVLRENNYTLQEGFIGEGETHKGFAADGSGEYVVNALGHVITTKEHARMQTYTQRKKM